MKYNPYLVVPFVTWIIAQFTKFLTSAARGRLDFKYLYSSGGMPSAHAAVVCSLAVTSLLVSGVGSPLFGFAAIFAAIVMYDSFGVRRSSGEQATALNMLIGSLETDKIPLRQGNIRLREVLGHTPGEVTVGALMGVLLGGLLNWSHIQPLVQFLSSDPVPTEFSIYLAVFAILALGGWVFRAWMGRKYGRSAAMRAFTKQVFIKTQALGWVGLIFSFSQYERLPYFSWRVWSLALIVVLIFWDAWLFSHWRRTVPPALTQEAEADRRLKWLRPRKKAKKR